MARRKVIGRDARRVKLKVGNLVIDEQGRTWKILETGKTYLRYRMLKVQRVRPPSSKRPRSVLYKRAYEVFRVRKRHGRAANAALWAHWSSHVILPPGYTRSLRPCPVCMGGWQPIRFKIGVRVWEKRKLRVCSRACRRVVRAKVREVCKRHPDVDKEKCRLAVAWKYMRKGGQA